MKGFIDFSNTSRRFGLALLMLGGLSLGAASAQQTQGEKLKACFVYVGDAQSAGWSAAHEKARKLIEKEVSFETTFAENVPEDNRSTPIIERMIQNGCRVIFATSLGFEEEVYKLAQKNPSVLFMQLGGTKRLPNLGSYIADSYQVYYLNGIMAAALSKTGRLGFVGSFAIPEIRRNANAFLLGAQTINPKANVTLKLTNNWANAEKAKAAAEALVTKHKVDTLIFTEDTSGVVQIASKYKLPTFGHFTPMYNFAPDYVVSGQMINWHRIYKDFLDRVKSGQLNATNLQKVSYWHLLSSQSVEMGAKEGMLINPKYIPLLKSQKTARGDQNVYEFIMNTYRALSEGRGTDPFTGPLNDSTGTTRVRSGVRANINELQTMDWLLPGISVDTSNP